MGFFDWLKGGKKAAPAAEEYPPPPAPPTEEDILAALAATEALVDSGVPTAVSSRVHRVTKVIRATLPRLESEGMQSQDHYSLMSTATNYLPEALGAYLRLPRDWADSRPIENGKSALMLLIDQLDLLGVTMERIFDAVNTADASALIAHGRFLQEKFGSQSTGGDLNLGNAAPVPPANPLDL